MKLLKKEQGESYENAKICHICKEKFDVEYLKYKKCRKVGDHRGNTEVLHIAYVI